MADEKKLRTLVEINNDYNRLCAQAGEKAYRIKTLEQDIQLLQKELSELILESVAVKEEEQKSKTEVSTNE